MEQKAKKILVVDDTEATRYAIARILRAHGYETVEAGTGREALRLVHSERPDLITLDIHLPDVLGFEVCRSIKSNPLTAHIPVLQVSASYVSSKDRIYGLEGGADSYLTHPFEPPVLIATIRSLLRSRQLNEELQLTSERFRVALKNAPIMIYTCDTDLKFTWIYNPPGSLVAEDVIGQPILDVFRFKDSEEIAKLKREAIDSGKGRRIGSELVFDGVDHRFDLTIEPYRNLDGEVSGLTVACIDVTERISAQLAQRKALEEAELANQAKTRFLSNMSHEIRTPLGVIQGFADLALDADASASERQEYLLTVKRNASNLTKLLGEILDLAKIEAGRIEIEKTRFSLRGLVDEVVAALSLQANEKGISLKFETEGRFPEFVESDCTRIRQILMNLINNAVKFTCRGGVVVKARALPRESENDHVMIEFRIIDTGIGLTAEQQTRLFQAFTQADSSTTRKFGGTGLGLNLSQRLSHSLGGDVILVESEFGRGSTLQFTFDAGILSAQDFAKRPLPGSADDPSALVTGKLYGMKILLVEDSIDNQKLVSRYLKRSGAVVDLACDGLEGVKLARQFDYSTILMDIQMPNLDGLEAVTILRAEGLKTPVIALTAHALKEERDRALSQGFDHYLTKPLNPVQLIKTVSQYRESSKELSL